MDSDNISIKKGEIFEIISLKYKQLDDYYRIEFRVIDDSLVISIFEEERIKDLYNIKLDIEDFYEVNETMKFCTNIEEIVEFLKSKIENQEVIIYEENDKLIFGFYIISQEVKEEPFIIELFKSEVSEGILDEDYNENKSERKSNLKNPRKQLKKQISQKIINISVLNESNDENSQEVQNKLMKLPEKGEDILNILEEDYIDSLKKEQSQGKLLDYEPEYDYDYNYENDNDNKYTPGFLSPKAPKDREYNNNKEKSLIPWTFKFKKGPNYNLIDECIAIKTSDGLWDATILGDKYLVKNKINCWKIKINKQYFGGGIMIGIAQHGVSQKKGFNFENSNTFVLSSYDLKKCIKGEWSNYANGYFKDGDIIKVIADLKHNTLEFEINGTNLGIAYDKLTNDVKYIPFIEMYHRGNEVELIDSKVL